MQTPEALGIIAGNGAYPGLVARAARSAGVKRIVAVAFTGETDPGLTSGVDTIEWLRVGQLARLLDFFRRTGVQHAMMADRAQESFRSAAGLESAPASRALETQKCRDNFRRDRR